MALVVDKPRKSSFRAERKPWMLKDYLRDDANSCSSSGFRSFPRRQCCVAVKNIIIQKDIRSSKPPPTTKRLGRTRGVSSVIQRASVAVINAVKLLPSSGGEVKQLLPRSFSKKLFKKSYFSFNWLVKKKSPLGEKKSPLGKEKKKVVMAANKVMIKKEECNEIERWISSGVVATEKYRPLDLSNDTSVTNASTISTMSNSNSNSNSNSSNNGKSDSWSDITFTSDYLSTLSENDVVERSEKIEEVVEEEAEEISNRVAVTVDDDSVEPNVTKNTWCNDEGEKEHFSPVSVMDFPDNDDGSSSPFTLRITRLKGSTERLMKKLGRFESLMELGLEPVNLESLITTTEMEDQSPKFSIQSCSTPTYVMSSESEEEEEETDEDEEESHINDVEKRVEHLLDIMKTKIQPTLHEKFDPANLLQDYFRENVVEKDDNALLKGAQDWINGHHDKLILGWEVKDKRQAYIRDMEEKGRWPRDTNLEKEEVATELGALVLSHLIEELLVE